MKYLPVIFLIFLSLFCIKRDKPVTILEIRNDHLYWHKDNPKKFRSKSFDINSYLNQKNQKVFENLTYSIFVDNRKAAKEYLLKRYDILYLEVNNKSNRSKNFQLSKMEVFSNGKQVGFFYPEELPEQFSRVNPKGMTKNVYNSVAVVVSIVPVLLVYLGGGMMYADADYNRMKEFQRYQRYVYTPPAIRPNRSGDFSFSRYFSSILHMNYVEYKDVFHENNEIERKAIKAGVLFLEKGVLSQEYEIVYNE